MGEQKFVQTVLVTWPGWPPCSYMVKPKKIFSSRTQKPITLKLGRQHGVLKYYQAVQLMILCWPWLILRQCQIWFLMLLNGKKCKTIYFSETIVAIWIVKVKVIRWAWSKVTQIQNFILFSYKLLGWLKPNFMWSLYWTGEWYIGQMVQVTWPVWTSCPYMVKTLKIFFSGTKEWWPWKLVCSIGYCSSTMFVQMITLGWPWPILWQLQIWSHMLLYGIKVK